MTAKKAMTAPWNTRRSSEVGVTPLMALIRPMKSVKKLTQSTATPIATVSSQMAAARNTVRLGRDSASVTRESGGIAPSAGRSHLRGGRLHSHRRDKRPCALRSLLVHDADQESPRAGDRPDEAG